MATAAKKKVNLALQGGGAHGAFTWGVLDALIEDGRLDIQAISATSAGSMNAVAMAYGWSIGGPQGARDKLTEFWRAVSSAGMTYASMQSSLWDRWLEGCGIQPEFRPANMAFEALTHTFSPYQLNPFDINPLRDVLERVIDFKRLHTCTVSARLFLSATNVRTSKIKVFDNKDLSADVVLATACLPYIFKAVEIAGEAYWDGGFMGNPPIYPLIYHGASKDVVIVHINPIMRQDIPKTASEIFDRINEVSFNSSLMREMRTIAFVARLVEEGRVDAKRYNRMLVHSIRDDEGMAKLSVSSKFTTDWSFLQRLRDVGRTIANAWLTANYGKINRASSIDVAATFL